ncbi:MAG: hypothetical protein A2458_01505 [Candidatus Kerfeldbacteria bacterium RIFOXYC2_FULL_38_9]|uniref:Hemerythrin-like domain-containing protein n=1 Tax=Candidatus Kerfeldbacteria bacterium RIFOXYB2_FULL_38_14 TaxID=1798547 RepID=A0A1G2BI00_9BACT|nr:MAG: hypothetical protein A2319_03925 [Candidatus Kerfeldbacteria bacterium RIFOXYB2_FULL_38_14]OGY89721.1 MAG: hypothetical protein A2458_01505 [Candidatus Kerfeldbacteria bacterium RIFOXYC2_FULL_38_9]
MGIISDFMDADHARLDKLWINFLQETQDPDKAFELFKQFQGHILLHMKLEDDFLFQRLNEYLKIEDHTGPTALAQRDHQGLIKLLSLVEKTFLTKEIEKITLTARHLHQALQKHRQREKNLHYSVCDAFISPQEWQIVLKKYYAVHNF